MDADENLYTGAVLSAYERRALDEIQEWRDEKEGTLKKALDAAGLPVEKLYGLLPDAGRKTLERAVLGAMEMLRDASRWSYPDAGIVREARKLDMEVDDYRDLRFQELADLDRLARRYFGTNKVIATLEGAGCGMGGIAHVFEDVAKKVTGVERRHYYNGLLLLSAGYGAWDVADYGTALEKLQAGRRELSVGFTEATLTERAGALVEHVGYNLSFLGKVQGKLSVENVVDMVENARRRISDQGRYDDGVARLYRAVEMWHQWRLLKRHAVSTKGVVWKGVPEEARARFLEATRLAQLPEDLDLTRARALDRILNGETAQDDNVFRDLLQKRNNSILAHGFKPVGEGPARRFLEYVDAVVDKPQVRSSAEHPRLREL